MTRYRDEIDMLRDIVFSLKERMILSHIALKTRLSTNECRKKLKFLMENQLIQKTDTIVNNKNNKGSIITEYIITEKGYNFLSGYAYLKSMINVIH